jgi:hypothetical protein
MSWPADRVDLFKDRLRELCDEAELPHYDAAEYDPVLETLYFLWRDPEYCLAAPLREASIYGMDAKMLRAAWAQKFGGPGGPNRAQRRRRAA